MKTFVRPLLIVALICALAACGMPDTTMENGAIKLYGDVVTLHVDAAPEADIAANGDFSIGGKAVAITPAERDMLAQYNRSVRAVHEAGLDMGKAGFVTAARAMAAEASSAPGHADAATNDGTGKLQDLTLDICKATAAIKSAQDRLATRLTVFRPYASIVGAASVTDCSDDAKG